MASLSALASNPDFQWFLRECIIARYDAARSAFFDESRSDTNIALDRAKFFEAREFRTWPLAQEIAWRHTLNPQDSELPALRERLALL